MSEKCEHNRRFTWDKYKHIKCMYCHVEGIEGQLASVQAELEGYKKWWKSEDDWYQLEKERDELREELEHYRGIAMTEGAEKALADYQALKDTADRYRKALERISTLKGDHNIMGAPKIAADALNVANTTEGK